MDEGIVGKLVGVVGIIGVIPWNGWLAVSSYVERRYVQDLVLFDAPS